MRTDEMKIDPKALLEAVRKVAREEVMKEVRGRLKEMVAEVLAEEFVRKVVAENVGVRPRSLAEELGVSEEAPVKVSEDRKERLRSLLSEENPFRGVYAGIEVEESSPPPAPSIAAPELSHYGEVFKAAAADDARKAPMRDPAYEEARLKRLRESLERPVT